MNRMECKTLCKLNKIKLGKTINPFACGFNGKSV